MIELRTLIVIFGITGDLSIRKLLPSLQNIASEGMLEHTQILGVSRRVVDTTELLAAALSGERGHDAHALADIIDIFTMDVADPADYVRLSQEIQRRLSAQTQVLFYLSVPPAATLPIVEHLGKAGLNLPHMKLLLEKPFGVDLVSAQETVAGVGAYFKESQLYRIDHYLAKEMAQNIIAFRSHNAIFRNLWHGDFIDRIEIFASEAIGVEGRVQFYEQTGALRDFLQNHLMQLMALTIMDIPSDFAAQDMPKQRQKALESIHLIQPDSFASQVLRGQYIGYEAEVNNPGTETETFVGLTLFSSDVRWANVPIRLATGKALAVQSTEIRVHFKKTHIAESNLLVLHIQPKEGIEIDLWAKKPGYDKDYEKMSLSFDYRQPAGRPVDAYERVLLDAISSDKSLFTTAGEVLASWRILQPVQHRWSFSSDDLRLYEKGTPIELLMESDNL